MTLDDNGIDPALNGDDQPQEPKGDVVVVASGSGDGQESQSRQETVKYYVCTYCREAKPLTPEYWYRNRARSTGYSSFCRDCRAEYTKMLKKRRTTAKQIVKSVSTASRAVATLLRQEDLAQAVLDRWGGLDGIMKDLRRDYLASKPGSMVRVKIISMLVSLIQGGIPRVVSGGFDEIPDEQIEKAIMAYGDRSVAEMFGLLRDDRREEGRREEAAVG